MMIRKKRIAARPLSGPLAKMAVLFFGAPFFLLGCLGIGPKVEAKPFSVPPDSRMVIGVPFFPDDENQCGPASLAAVMTFAGRPTSLEEASLAVQRSSLRGSLGPDLVLWARQQGMRAKFFSSNPEELVEFIGKQQPIIVMVDQGLGPVRKGHFMVAVGYHFEGLVANNGLVQQEIIPWTKFLTDWYKTGYFAILVEGKEPDSGLPEVSPEASPTDSPTDSLADSPEITPDEIP
jgi:hypothetical protein